MIIYKRICSRDISLSNMKLLASHSFGGRESLDSNAQQIQVAHYDVATTDWCINLHRKVPHTSHLAYAQQPVEVCLVA
jgi:hypothetical protein